MSTPTPKLSFKKIDSEKTKYEVTMENVRVSFPYLWRPNVGSKYYNPNSPKLTCSFIIDKSLYQKLAKLIVSVASEVDDSIEDIKDIDRTRRRIKYDKDSDMFILNTSNNESHPPSYINSNGKREPDPLAVEADKKLYAGCYAKIKVTIDASENQYGTMIWTNLVAIQFMQHGERLAGVTMSDEELEDGFDSVEVDDDFENDDSGDEFNDDDLDLDDLDDISF